MPFPFSKGLKCMFIRVLPPCLPNPPHPTPPSCIQNNDERNNQRPRKLVESGFDFFFSPLRDRLYQDVSFLSCVRFCCMRFLIHALVLPGVFPY